MNDLKKLFEQAVEGNLPPDFDQWGLKDDWGSSVAHVAAKHGHLPPEFDQWGIMNDEGWTVAHSAAFHGHLPPDFDRWDLKDIAEWSVRDIYDLWKKNADKMKGE
ncbi:ankyrin repeat domain-containing protein [Thiolapillus sp.]|uniref:ankyrin repeat domain-containing protein n=1 Tax=Thiolapillus sp. TaxID=2017437 RepID=UPI003AF85185